MNDLVDYVTLQGILAGKSAAKYINNETNIEKRVHIEIDGNLRLVAPQYLSFPILEDITFYFRVKEPQKSAILTLKDKDKRIKEWRFPVVKPAEMIVIKVKPEFLRDIESPKFYMEG